jgi:hypothetical protein
MSAGGISGMNFQAGVTFDLTSRAKVTGHRWICGADGIRATAIMSERLLHYVFEPNGGAEQFCLDRRQKCREWLGPRDALLLVLADALKAHPRPVGWPVVSLSRRTPSVLAAALAVESVLRFHISLPIETVRPKNDQPAGLRRYNFANVLDMRSCKSNKSRSKFSR